MKISRILHAGYVFESGSTQIVFDPIFENPFSRNCFAFPDVEFDYAQIQKLTPAAVFISHYHDDHCSLESLQHINRETPIFMYCIHEELFSLIKELGFLKVTALRVDKVVEIGPFQITPRLALDPDVDSVFHIQAEGLHVLNLVDAWMDPSALEQFRSNSWDLVLWPFQTMREIEVIAPELALPPELPTEWLEQLKILNPRFIVPSSCQFIHEPWSWYRKSYFPISYEAFRQEVTRLLPSAKFQRLNPGVSIELDRSQLSESIALSWVVPKGEQNVDYAYDPHVKPQDTGEIAGHFAKLSTDQMQRVLKFCEFELIEKYNAMNTELSGLWTLKVFDQTGSYKSFCYELKNGKIKNSLQQSHWITELPGAKLFAALEEGESLSSLYLRMQGMPFEEIFEDPLVACLFSGDFAEYQRQQLKKLRIWREAKFSNA